MSKINVYVDALPISSARVSGVGHSILGLITALAKLPDFATRYQLVLVTSTRGLPYLKGHHISGVKYRTIPMPSRIWMRFPATWLMPPMDLLLGRGIYIFANYRAWPLASSKSITFIYDISYLLFPDSTTPRHQHMLATWVPRWIRRSTRIAAISHSVSKELEEVLNVPAEKLVYIPCGIDLATYYRRSEDEVAHLRKKYDLPSNYILFLGNIEPRKNLARLVRSYCALSPKIKSEHPLLLVGGASWQSEGIENEVKKAQKAGNNVIRPTKYFVDEDLPALYSGASMLAHPALYEGFGFTPLQAMACGTPVMAGNNSSMPEVTGHGALLVDVASEHQITDTMTTILMDKTVRDRLISAGLDRVKRYTWASSATKLLATIRTLSQI